MEGDGLGSCIRAWRRRLAPSTAGLAPAGTRRTPGLRREDLAALAGLSVDYLVRLEQGRATHPSREVLTALAAALRLTSTERDHLFALAGMLPPRPRVLDPTLTPAVHRLLDQLAEAAVAVFDDAWNLLTWNSSWVAVLGDPSGWRGRDRNRMWRHFHGLPSRVVQTDEDRARFERVAVADLQLTATRFADDRELHQMLAELRASSPRFAAIWSEHDLVVPEAAPTTVDHPLVGRLTLHCDGLRVEGSHVRVVAYTAERGTPDAERFSAARRSPVPSPVP